MIQDIGEGLLRNEYARKREPREGDMIFAFRGRNVLVCTKDIDGDGVRDITVPTVTGFDGGTPGAGRRSADITVPSVAGFDGQKDMFLQYLFEVGGMACFLLMNEDPAAEAPEIPGFSYEKLSVLRRSRPRPLSFAGETAYQLFCWYRDNRYCGRCGHRMNFGEEERNMVCPVCGNRSYPRIMPAVIVGVTDGERILMTRYRGREYHGHALIAGFCEIGETGEDTVRREVFEEAGVRVKNIRYYKSQPWGFDSDLLLGYYCELDGDDTIRMEEDELSAAEWVRREDIKDRFENMSLTNEMIVRFRELGTER